MKLRKYMAMMLLAALTAGTASSCSDDDSQGDAPRLFTPIITTETSNNNIIVTWDNISGATQYDLQLLKVSGTNENGENTYEVRSAVSCESSPYTFSDLEWDEKYKVTISCSGNGKTSHTGVTTSDINVPYATSLKSVSTIANAARVTWEPTAVSYKAIVATPEDGGISVVKQISDAEISACTADVEGLEPNTKYTFYAYTDEKNFTNSTYAGKINGTTSKPLDLDSEYGAGLWIDITGYDEKQAKDTLKTKEFWEQVPNGATIILKANFDYKVNNSQPLSKSVRFVTEQSLSSNARFISSGGMTMASGAEVDFLEFVNVDFISDKAIPGGGYEVVRNTESGGDKGFGGRQVFNVNGTKSTLKNISFKGCHIEGYRAIVRAQSATDNVNNIVFENCVINGIGDQGVVTTTNNKADWQNITFKNCTITNIVMLCDLRATANELTMNIENCTFCYAPIETTANANTPLFRFGDNAAKLNITNTLFGPSMMTEGGAGSKIHPYEPGTNGSILLNGASALVSVSKSFKTNFAWAVINEKTYPIDGLNELTMDEEKLWNNPSGDDFKLIGNIGESGIGDARWQ